MAPADLTEAARRVMDVAQGEARDLGHGHLGTEHVLLALAQEGSSLQRALRRVAFDASTAREELRRVTNPTHPPLRAGDAEALRSLGIDLEEVRRRTERTFGTGALTRPLRTCRPNRSITLALAVTPKTKRAMEAATRRTRPAGAADLLVALLTTGENLAVELLSRQGIAAARILAALDEELRQAG